jgi:hypothetical protein
MTAIDNTPFNKNFLSPLNFRFQLKRAPHVNFFCQEANLPSISFNRVPVQNTPFATIPLVGDHLTFEPLNITFKVDEDLENYLEIHNWLIALGEVESTGMYKQLQDNPSYTGETILGDISLMILSSSKNPNFDVTFKDAFPTSLSELKFRTTDENVSYITASASFRYVNYVIDKI